MGSSLPKLTPQVDVRRATDRKHTALGWLDSRHSFSFGRHYDPANTHFGLLLVNNDDVVEPGLGFETHHRRGTRAGPNAAAVLPPRPGRS
jgi:redox-sensitive bicupin YhaK (pirin superfamily)